MVEGLPDRSIGIITALSANSSSIRSQVQPAFDPRLTPFAARSGLDFARFSPAVANRTTKHAKLAFIGLFRHERRRTALGSSAI